MFNGLDRPFGLSNSRYESEARNVLCFAKYHSLTLILIINLIIIILLHYINYYHYVASNFNYKHLIIVINYHDNHCFKYLMTNKVIIII
jgi:hypothetical protein